MDNQYEKSRKQRLKTICYPLLHHPGHLFFLGVMAQVFPTHGHLYHVFYVPMLTYYELVGHDAQRIEDYGEIVSLPLPGGRELDTEDLLALVFGETPQGKPENTVVDLEDNEYRELPQEETAEIPEEKPAARAAEIMSIEDSMLEVLDLEFGTKGVYKKETKKGAREIDLRPGIYHMSWSGDAFYMLLDASSAGNIKPVQVVEALLAETGETLQENALFITREDVYTKADKEGNRADDRKAGMPAAEDLVSLGKIGEIIV